MPILYFLVAMLLIGGGGATTNLFRSTPSTANCQPNLELNEWIKVDIDPAKETLATGAPLYKDKEGKLWVLIKRDAPIPAWKVWSGAIKKREGETIGEMEEAGVVLSSSTPSYIGKRVFVGLGHCNGIPGSTCTDPLVQDALFVATKEGAESPLPDCLGKWPDAGSPECQRRPDYWWEFNVYLDASLLPPNPTNNSLPCWAKLACGKGDIMGEKRKEVWEEFLRTGVCKAGQVLGATSSVPSFVIKSGINFTDPNFDKSKLIEVYWYKEEVTTNPLNVGAIEVGTYLHNSSSFAVLYLEPGGVVFLSPLPSKNKFYSYEEITKTVRPQGKTLQLGTFNPQRSLAYEWWTPACKPAIYLYPEKPTQLSIKVKPQGRITVSDPYHGEEGWEVMAYPDGIIRLSSNGYGDEVRIEDCQGVTVTKPVSSSGYGDVKKENTLPTDVTETSILTDKRNPNNQNGLLSPNQTTYPYLYYETQLAKVKIPQKGWIVEREELQEFFDEILPQLGLNEKEKQDFLSYWLPKLDEYLTEVDSVSSTSGESLGHPRGVLSASPQLFVGLIDREELDRVEPIEFSTKPDTFIRVRFYFEKLDGAEDTFQVSEWTPGRWRKQNDTSDLGFSASPRHGFTAVDWGGILENGSCGIGEKSQ